MHPRNPYASTRPDFAQLAASNPTLKPYVTVTDHGPSIDFHDAAALRALTAALLKTDFNLDVDLRDDRLCPTIANRLDYILTCLDVAQHAPAAPLRALDIGTGHVAIYALLLHRLRADAHIYASELDPTSLAHATHVVAANGAAAAITLLPGCTDGYSLLAWLGTPSIPATTASRLSFTLCNPPFFASDAEAVALRESKAGPAPAAPTCSANEEITRGGEESFIGQMVDESRQHRDQVCWFTSLVGRYASLGPLVARVKRVTDNYAVIKLQQSRTARWVLVWGYTPYRLPDSITRPAVVEPGTSFAHLLPLSNSFSIRPTPPRTADQLREAVMAVLQDVDLVPLVQAAEATQGQDEDGDGDEAKVDAEGEISARATGTTTFQLDLAPMVNSWSRAARRARAQAQAQPAPVEQDQPANGAAEPALADKPATATATEPLPETEPLFRARLVIVTPADGAQGADADAPQVLGARVTLEWTWGRDRTLVDAFWKD
ncbi:uncharacterized protein EHS24_002361 [Apiotrichum porosum]|uniref:Methyltransferase-like protein 16 n=1 Tax=Apiotrichum porosum TaxID=105984 RepID=A0A427XII9_9TREE|nr:uncharacterized protein EHS24_002361 [Apiotrichum porosum]RSH78632.1 hypothetical protein EHS24_002361 [Apiotrichum porosum]